MEKENLNKKVIFAAKWSTITELLSKIVAPISTIILARILAPEAFGVIAVITMIISFLEIFTDAGFQKYLIQKDFKNKYELYQNSNVAFWTNLFLSIIIWLLIFIAKDFLARIVGSPNLGNVIAISTLQLPVMAVSSIQIALFRRNLEYKKLFQVRLFSILVPFFVTLPLALMGLNYWSIIIGSFVIQLLNAFLLMYNSEWKPSRYFNFSVLKQMLSFSLWTLVESLAIWLTVWIDAFLIATSLNQFYLGLYRTSTSLVNSLLSIITAALLPVLFSALSRLQDDNNKFMHVYLKFQRLISILVFPLGLIIFFYSDIATSILLGNQWTSASSIIGIWGLTSALMIVFGNFCSEVYRSKGRPKLSVLAQILHLVFLIPAIMISSRFGFWTLVYVRSLFRIQFILVHFIIMKVSIGISIKQTLSNVKASILSSIVMIVLIISIKDLFESFIWSALTLLLSIIGYIIVLLVQRQQRQEIFDLFKKIKLNEIMFKKIKKRTSI